MVDEKRHNDPEIRLLLVDDESVFRRNMHRLLTARGFRVQEAGNGHEALKRLGEASFHVVLLDVRMPGMSGLEVLQRIKKKHAGTEVILLTGQASVRDGVTGIRSGAFDYLSKPVEIDHLTGKTRQAYEKIVLEENRRRESEFRTRMEQRMIAAERLAALGTLAAGVAHEINNPLAVIKQSVRWLNLRMAARKNESAVSREDVERVLRHIGGAVERARRITHQLLGSTRENGNAAREIDVNRLVGSTVEWVNRTAADSGVTIEVRPDHRLGMVRCNPDKLRQVLTNLLINAVQATPAGGRVTVSTQDAEDAFVLWVRDTGEGIPEKHLDRIFEPFFTTKPAGEGTGLGLFVTRTFLDSLGGTIAVESRMGMGTEICVRLPKTRENTQH